MSVKWLYLEDENVFLPHNAERVHDIIKNARYVDQMSFDDVEEMCGDNFLRDPDTKKIIAYGTSPDAIEDLEEKLGMRFVANICECWSCMHEGVHNA